MGLGIGEAGSLIELLIPKHALNSHVKYKVNPIVTYLHTIENIREIYGTGSRPVIVHCNDLNDYLCKYDAPTNLLSEYLAAQFLGLWNLKFPECAFISIAKEHIGNLRLNPQLLDKVAFGTRFYDHADDVTGIFEMKSPSDISRIKQKEAFLKIGLFDLWLSNEDRCANNSNILLVPFEEGEFFVPIDHSAIFNTGAVYTHYTTHLERLTQEDSIICTHFTPLMFKHGKTLSETLEILESDFKYATKGCEVEVDQIFGNVPVDWDIDEHIKDKICSNIFNDNWKSETWQTFLQYLQLTLR